MFLDSLHSMPSRLGGGGEWRMGGLLATAHSKGRLCLPHPLGMPWAGRPPPQPNSRPGTTPPASAQKNKRGRKEKRMKKLPASPLSHLCEVLLK